MQLQLETDVQAVLEDPFGQRARFDQALGRIRERLDHHFLDEVPGLGPATLENLSRFIFTALAPELPGLVRVMVSRDLSGDSCCYWPDPASPTPGTGASLLEQWSQLA